MEGTIQDGSWRSCMRDVLLWLDSIFLVTSPRDSTEAYGPPGGHPVCYGTSAIRFRINTSLRTGCIRLAWPPNRQRALLLQADKFCTTLQRLGRDPEWAGRNNARSPVRQGPLECVQLSKGMYLELAKVWLTPTGYRNRTRSPSG